MADKVSAVLYVHNCVLFLCFMKQLLECKAAIKQLSNRWLYSVIFPFLVWKLPPVSMLIHNIPQNAEVFSAYSYVKTRDAPIVKSWLKQIHMFKITILLIAGFLQCFFSLLIILDPPSFVPGKEETSVIKTEWNVLHSFSPPLHYIWKSTNLIIEIYETIFNITFHIKYVTASKAFLSYFITTY